MGTGEASATARVPLLLQVKSFLVSALPKPAWGFFFSRIWANLGHFCAGGDQILEPKELAVDNSQVSGQQHGQFPRLFWLQVGQSLQVSGGSSFHSSSPCRTNLHSAILCSSKNRPWLKVSQAPKTIAIFTSSIPLAMRQWPLLADAVAGWSAPFIGNKDHEEVKRRNTINFADKEITMILWANIVNNIKQNTQHHNITVSGQHHNPFPSS